MTFTVNDIFVTFLQRIICCPTGYLPGVNVSFSSVCIFDVLKKVLNSGENAYVESVIKKKINK